MLIAISNKPPLFYSHKNSHVRYVIKGQRNTFATLKSSNVISFFHRKTVSSPLYVLENQCLEQNPILYQRELQLSLERELPVTRKTFLWSIKAPCKSVNSNQQISLDADGVESCRLTPYPIKARNPVRIFTSDEIANRSTQANFTANIANAIGLTPSIK